MLNVAEKLLEKKKIYKFSNNFNFVTSVSLWERFELHFFAYILGFWIVAKRFCRWLWTPNTFFQQQLRDNPPSCLLDTTLGQHRYVKLKVSVKIHFTISVAFYIFTLRSLIWKEILWILFSSILRVLFFLHI